MNLIVQEGLKVIDHALHKIRESVKHVKGSQIRKLRFATCLSQLSYLTSKKVHQDVPTRWNSTYLMLDIALSFREAFAHLNRIDSNFKCFPSDTEWDVVERIAKFLKPFYEITTLFSGTQYPTANLHFLGVWKIQSRIMEEVNPSTKIFGSNGESKVLEVRHKLYLLYNEYLSSELSTNHSSLATTYYNSQGQLDATDELQGFDMFESQLFESSRAKSHLDIYLEEKRLCYKHYPYLDVLAFWKSNQHRYNELSLLARDIVCIPITTVASESSFSIGGHILDKYRSCLLPENVEAILCTQNWLSSKPS
ncbi:zinc finger BED domain-containing protein RICESLEEPER 2-like [Senna tora]|uniref:Zinc finger BED domain-containing protein RICESLEEPER 2-like n=1 Tax=Senna tora TaxID=362788 RepID=A0A834WSD1_9FABA|nr:zinc finger BED domain-containing protein RICESLEEPER 2-like [Senna tora]